jgi:hypothetical protein
MNDKAIIETFKKAADVSLRDAALKNQLARG